MKVFLKIIMASFLLFSFTSLAMENFFVPKFIKTLTGPFFYSIFPGKSKTMFEDKSLMVLTTHEFYIVKNYNYETKKTCKSLHGKVRFAFFSPSGKYIISTSIDDTVEIWNSECKSIAILKDNIDGIYLAIFGKDDQEIITSTHNNDYSKVWRLEPVYSRL